MSQAGRSGLKGWQVGSMGLFDVRGSPPPRKVPDGEIVTALRQALLARPRADEAAAPSLFVMDAAMAFGLPSYLAGFPAYWTTEHATTAPQASARPPGGWLRTLRVVARSTSPAELAPENAEEVLTLECEKPEVVFTLAEFEGDSTVDGEVDLTIQGQ